VVTASADDLSGLPTHHSPDWPFGSDRKLRLIWNASPRNLLPLRAELSNGACVNASFQVTSAAVQPRSSKLEPLRLEFDMKMIRGMMLTAIVAATTVSTFSTPALAHDRDQERGWYDRRDNRYDDRDERRDRDQDDVRLRGPGVSDLHPWFRNAQSGRLFAARRAGSYISERDAWMLNREYSRLEGWR
jgi:hypothetical protein